MEEYPKLSKEIAGLETEIAEFEAEGYEDRFVAPYVNFLKKGGFLLESGDLTQKGVCATEINEAHPILLAEAVMSGMVDGLNQEEIVGFLSVFIKEGEKGGEGSPSIASLRILEGLRGVLRELGAMTDRFWDIEKVCGIPPNIYWDLSTFWVEIGIAWLGGKGEDGTGRGVAAICSQFEIFEGNLYKYVMSMSNMLEELTSVATLCEKTALLEKLEGIKELLMPLNSLPWSESLYLRL
jgi:superfamily II RNA helicase